MPNPLDLMAKLDSRLRCVANGNADVNAVRAQQNGAVRLRRSAQRLAVPDVLYLTASDSIKHMSSALEEITRGPQQTSLPEDVEVNVFVLLNRENAATPKTGKTAGREDRHRSSKLSRPP